MFGAFPSVREQEKGLTSRLTHPKARAHSGDQPLRPEVVVPRNSRRAVVPVLLWPLRPEAMVPRTHRRAVGPSCLALATRGRGAEELPPSGCPCTSLALATRGRGSWTVRRAVGPSCLLMTLAGYSDRLQLEARAATTLRPRRSQAGLAGP